MRNPREARLSVGLKEAALVEMSGSIHSRALRLRNLIFEFSFGQPFLLCLSLLEESS